MTDFITSSHEMASSESSRKCQFILSWTSPMRLVQEIVCEIAYLVILCIQEQVKSIVPGSAPTRTVQTKHGKGIQDGNKALDTRTGERCHARKYFDNNNPEYRMVAYS
jgi:hypothetical protein